MKESILSPSDACRIRVQKRRFTGEIIAARRTVEQVELATIEYVWWWNNQRLHGCQRR
ncbi:IS3 family transposase [Herbiconiux sp. VKM Ac-2851]|uniref:IS3 family transposase n=1 Tax=Herbiconiux sp. VKM Ac-2851 TaxID=2739025 RepID=UPI001564C24E|nr:IS3 family transposase [Herbiconiux sp. VKM Ac-2851]